MTGTIGTTATIAATGAKLALASTWTEPPRVNCRDIESLILAERDGALTTEQRATLSDHVAACSVCTDLRQRVNTALDAFKSDARAVPTPNVEQAWRDVRAALHTPERKTKPKRLAPVIWFGAPLAAAAALAISFLGNDPGHVIPEPMPGDVARADFVEAGNTSASTMVYVDKESGWLVVWASDDGGSAAGVKG